MSTTSADEIVSEPTPTPPSTDGAATPDAAGSRWQGATMAELWQRWRWPLALLLVVVVVGVATVLLRGDSNNRYLDPAGTGPDAAGALATVVADNGVQLRRVPRVQDAVDGLQPGDVVFVPRPELTSPEGLDRLLSTPSATVVLVLEDKSLVSGDGLLTDSVPGLKLQAGDAGTSGRRPACELALTAGIDAAQVGGTTFSADRSGIGCFATGGRPSLLWFERSAQQSRLVLLGSGGLFTNGRLAADDDAAVALRLLGGGPRLVWVMPTADEIAGGAAGGAGSFYDLIPSSARLVALQVLLAVLLLALWRARRLGPVVPENLPVIVRGAEVVEGRGRLYARHRARARSAALLRAGTLAPVRPRLGLPADASPEAVVRMVSARTGRPEDEVGRLLYGPAPADDAALVRLAGDLDRLTDRLADLLRRGPGAGL